MVQNITFGHTCTGWARAGHTFGLFFWPHVQLKVVSRPKPRYHVGTVFVQLKVQLKVVSRPKPRYLYKPASVRGT